MRVAHLSDVHALEPPGRYGWGTKFVSIGRKLDAVGRAQKLRRALALAKESGADHFVISGDLTELGTPAQFESFAATVHEAAISPERVTLVPGNHDLYTAHDAWQKALVGPLRAFAEASAGAPGVVVDRGEAVFLPLDLTMYQSVARSGGNFSDGAASALGRRLADPSFARRALVVVQHHPPFTHPTVWQWIDGLRGATQLMAMLSVHAHVQVLHGHLHHLVDRIIGYGKKRVFGAPAVVDDLEGEPRVRVYDVVGRALNSVA